MARRLAAHHEEIIERIVESGGYGDADAVIDQALRLLVEQEERRQIRAKLQSGIDQLDRGEGIVMTPEWRRDRLRIARERAAAGEQPHPDVCP